MTLFSAVATAESDGPLGVFQGLPVHPLVVHAAVVFIPLAALGLILAAVWPRFGARYGWLTTILSLVAAGSALLASESGEALEELIGEPRFDHAEIGDKMPFFAGVMFLAALVLWLLQRAVVGKDSSGGRVFMWIVAILSIVVAVANIYWVIRTGHTGAESVWEGDLPAGS